MASCDDEAPDPNGEARLAEPPMTELSKSRDDSRLLVCEGVCNPGIRDYDQVVEREGYRVIGSQGHARRMALTNIVEWGRDLVHTRHDRTLTTHTGQPRGPVWKGGSWFREFRCSVCGSLKLF